MHCPKCKTVEMTDSNLEPELANQYCPSCEGNWLFLEDYLNWKITHDKEVLPQNDESLNIEEIIDTKTALLCPISGGLMSKFRISNQSEHRLDISAKCGGIWLDKGEWELLKEFKLTLELNRIFTDSWQNQLRSATTKDVLTKLYNERFGEQDYQKLIEIKHWIDQHPKQKLIRSFLMNNDPWSIIK